MKKILTLTLAVAAVALAGCASLDPQYSAANAEVDYQKIDLVNHWAERNNVEVKWVNYPMRYRTQTTSSQ